MLFSSAEESDPELLSESDPEPESEEREFLLFLELLEESESSLLDESCNRAPRAGGCEGRLQGFSAQDRTRQDKLLGRAGNKPHQSHF